MTQKSITWCKWLSNTDYQCPHVDCKKLFRLPYNKHGILFCPHCEQSLLLKPPKINNTNTLSDLNFEWAYLTKPKSWLISITSLSLVILFKSLDTGQYFLWLVILFAGFALVLIVIKSLIMKGHQDFTVLLTHYKKTFYAGGDTLLEVTNNPFQLIAPNGLHIVNQNANRDIFSSYVNVECCPQCSSQQLIDINKLLILNDRFFEEHNIPRPKQIPKSGYDPVAKKYITASQLHYITCLHCHNYFQWQQNKATVDDRSIVTQLLNSKLLRVLLLLFNFAFFLIGYLILFPSILQMSYFNLIETNSLFDLTLFSNQWWRVSSDVFLDFILSLVLIQVLIFLYVTLISWSKQHRLYSVTLKQVKVDY